jgi:hypothetical protein
MKASFVQNNEITKLEEKRKITTLIISKNLPKVPVSGYTYSFFDFIQKPECFLMQLHKHFNLKH